MLSLEEAKLLREDIIYLICTNWRHQQSSTLILEKWMKIIIGSQLCNKTQNRWSLHVNPRKN